VSFSKRFGRISGINRQLPRRGLGVAAVATAFAVFAVLTAFTGPSASAADDEPDLLPFIGSYALGCSWNNGCTDGHHGSARPALDFPMPEGTPVVAAADGVIALYEDSCAGRYIELWHAGARKWSRYLHLSAFAVRDGATVTRGQVIAYSGNTGSDCSTGPHLHYDEIDPTRHRVDPGPMVGLVSGTWRTYPGAIGVSSWNQMGAFFGPALRNDYLVGNPTPTTLGTTTTLPTTTAPPPPATTGAPPPTTTTPGTPPPGSALAEGTLFRAADAPNVFVYAAGGPWWVADAAQVELLGGWGRVQVLGGGLDALLTAMPWRPLQHRAFVEAGNPAMYWCAGGSPWPVRSFDELAALQAATGGSGWSTLPAGASTSQWACGGTLAGTVFQRRATSGFWVWTTGGWARYADGAALAAAGYSPAGAGLLPAS